MQRYWQAANYLTVAQIYLLDNPLLREPLQRSTSSRVCSAIGGRRPGLSFIYVHLNRLINERDANVIYLTGPGHGGARLVAQALSEGHVFGDLSRGGPGRGRVAAAFAASFSTPGGIRSHVSVQTPGSIHEGGELGYVLSHAFGAVFDNPDLIVARGGRRRGGDGAVGGSWKGTSFLNPARDGAVLPILHLNGYKISGPTVLGRDSDSDVRALLQGNGYEVRLRRGRRPRARARRRSQPPSTGATRRSVRYRRDARARGVRAPALARHRPAHAKRLDRTEGGRRLPVEGTFRAHQVPLAQRAREPPNTSPSSKRGCAATGPEELFDARGSSCRSWPPSLPWATVG